MVIYNKKSVEFNFTFIMDKQLKNRFPKWIHKINKDHKLILTDDLDSLFSCAILNKLFGCEVGLFYDFSSIYSKQNKYKKSDLIGVDLAIEDKEVKTFCNHVTKMWKDDEVNPLSANLNNIANINTMNYTKKYAGSTLMLILSIYDAIESLYLGGHSELTEMQKMILVSVDSYFYSRHFRDGEQFYMWQELMGLEMFNDVLDRYSKSDLIDFQREFDLKGSIYIDNNMELGTTLNIDFLREHFPMLDFNINYKFSYVYDFTNTVRQKFITGESKHDLTGDVFSLSVINKNTVKYTLV